MNPPPHTIPSLQAGDDTKNVLLKLALILKRTDVTHNSLLNQAKTTFVAVEKIVTKKITKLFQPQSTTVIKQKTPIKPNPTQPNCITDNKLYCHRKLL